MRICKPDRALSSYVQLSCWSVRATFEDWWGLRERPCFSQLCPSEHRLFLTTVVHGKQRRPSDRTRLAPAAGVAALVQQCVDDRSHCLCRPKTLHNSCCRASRGKSAATPRWPETEIKRLKISEGLSETNIMTPTNIKVFVLPIFTDY